MKHTLEHPPAHSGPTRRSFWHALSWRNLKYGSHASVFTVIVLAVSVLLYSLAMRHNQRWDVTRGKRFTLAEQSVKLVQSLKDPIKVIGFFRLEDRERGQFEDLLKQYAQQSDKLTYEVVDPDRQPARTKQYEVTAYNTIVVAGNNKQEKVFRIEEAALTNALVKVIRDTKKVIYFASGHGEPALTDTERGGYSLAKQSLEEQNYVVHDIVLARQAEVPKDAAVLIIAGPRQNLLEPEIQMLKTFVEHGGRLILMLDPETSPALIPFVKQYGLELSADVVIETNPLGRLIGGDYLMPVVMNYEQHPITKELGNLMTIFPFVRSVQVATQLPDGITAQTLASTSPESWAETDLATLKSGQSAFDEKTDRKGPISIAAVATIPVSQPQAPAAPTHASTAESKTPAAATATAATETDTPPNRPARLVVFGDSEFANNNFFPSPGNGNLFLNTVSWLAEEDDLLAIRPREHSNSGPIMLTEAQAPWIFWIPVVFLPFGVLAIGTIVFFRRRWQQ